MNTQSTATPVPPPRSVVECLAAISAAGFQSNLIPCEGGVRVSGTEQVVPSGRLITRVIYRVEGMSNPADSAIVYGLELPSGERGALVLGYGPSASQADAGLLTELPDKVAS